MAAKRYVCSDPKHKFTNYPFMIKTRQLALANAVTACDKSGSADEVNSSDEGDVWTAVATTTLSTNSLEWLLDSVATHYLCGNRDLMPGLEPSHLPIRVANGAVNEATAKEAASL
ncbi:hypothetical protein GN244_ATG08524 [Phytophthora infestans]|uniref:Uncharacterized protein n=1 Tax=Phytophthora infestans TaxID=4787 RepID=A0A833T4M0_PHYIN|nr:hypothetical protein GN244_ATG08524 [Phytophthora infestans]